jgi:NAD(P)-dependent dehydrogenase (short-subunit alcohol dehydrogenase family)
VTQTPASPGLNFRGQPRIASRFGSATTAAEVVAGLDLSGRRAIVTGGGGGIGVEIARALAGAGAEVIVADVDTDAARATAAALNAGTAAGRVAAAPLDLASFASVDRFAAEVVAGGRHLDILINNAGVMAPPLRRTAEGHELQLGVNHLGHYRLTMGLLPVLRGGPGARVVCVSSIGHRRSDIRYDDPDYLTRPYDRWEAYGQSKTACALIALALDARLAGEGVSVNTMNPGGSMTGLQRHMSEGELREMGWIDAEGRPIARWRSPAQCAATSVWLATAPDLAGIGGRYFEACTESAPWHPDLPMNGVHPHITPDNAERLWELTRRMAGV